MRTALSFVAERFPSTALCLAGFSFGSWVGLPVGCADVRVRQLIGVGVPVASLMTDTLGDCEKSKLIIQGEQDQYGGPSKLAPWFEQLPEPKQLVMVPGADHFFSDFQTELYQAVYAYFKDGNSAVGPLPGM